MSSQRGKLITCDRCGEKIFLKELEVEEKETDGGWTRWNEYKYEDFPKGWDNVYFSHNYGSYLLCPSCNVIFDEVKSQFFEYKEQECQQS